LALKQAAETERYKNFLKMRRTRQELEQAKQELSSSPEEGENS
jgi:hypothetical protein